MQPSRWLPAQRTGHSGFGGVPGGRASFSCAAQGNVRGRPTQARSTACFLKMGSSLLALSSHLSSTRIIERPAAVARVRFRRLTKYRVVVSWLLGPGACIPCSGSPALAECPSDIPRRAELRAGCMRLGWWRELASGVVKRNRGFHAPDAKSGRPEGRPRGDTCSLRR